jgi:hypothetical protein
LGEQTHPPEKCFIVRVVKQGMSQRGFNPAACFDIWLATFHIMEMLYDTPSPEMPQTDRMPEKADRNAEIVARYRRVKPEPISLKRLAFRSKESIRSSGDGEIKADTSSLQGKAGHGTAALS